jgi:hypothetical protein
VRVVTLEEFTMAKHIPPEKLQIELIRPKLLFPEVQEITGTNMFGFEKVSCHSGSYNVLIVKQGYAEVLLGAVREPIVPKMFEWTEQTGEDCEKYKFGL